MIGLQSEPKKDKLLFTSLLAEQICQPNSHWRLALIVNGAKGAKS